MKFRSLHNWKSDDSLKGLLFFVQRMDELNYDLTLDSFKPSALNSQKLVTEALLTIRAIQSNKIESVHLKHILEELIWSIRQDTVAKKLLELDLKQYIPETESTNLGETKIRLELLYSCINSSAYLSECKSQIYRAVKEIKKSDINRLSSNFTTTLRLFGYHTTHIRELTKRFFYYDVDREISSIDILNDYFEIFSLKKLEYSVTFSASPLFKSLSDSCNLFGIEVTDKLPDCDNEKKWAEKHDVSDVYLTATNVPAYDMYAAREIAERRVEKLRNIFTLFHHNYKLRWSRKSLVKCKTSNICNIIDKPISPANKSIDLNVSKAAKEMHRLLDSFSLDSNSFRKYDSVIDLHSMAIASDINETQLLNLWISFETLIPQPKKKQSKVNHIINIIMPFLMQNYIGRIIEALTYDLRRWNPKAMREYFSKITHTQATSYKEKIAALLVLEEYDDLRNDLYSRLGDFELLRYRVFSLSKSFNKPSGIKDLLETHKKKVDWQIRRIYRTRNKIVHSATTPTYIHTLIENAHDYLDIFLEETKKFACSTDSIDSIEEVSKYVDLKQEKRMRLINKKGFEINADNFKDALL